ncbi:hypothetical protein D3X67_20490, partial [Acinetobacter baumannii]
RPIGCAINFRCQLIHLKIILWNKPLEIGLCNKAVPYCNHKNNISFLGLAVRYVLWRKNKHQSAFKVLINIAEYILSLLIFLNFKNKRF